MKREQFRKQAQSAIGDGSRARAELARIKANQFLTGSADFNPQDLQRLGSKGLHYFLDSVGQADLLITAKNAVIDEQSIKSPVSKSRQHGWSHQRRSEPFWMLRAILFGRRLPRIE